MIDAFLNFLHVVGVLIWIGGMFYTLFVLRPSLSVISTDRASFVETVMGRFFKFVWIAILLLLITGGYRAHIHIHSLVFDLKLFVYTVMVLIFSYIYFVLFQKLKKSTLEENPFLIKKITLLIKTNFGLGLLVILLIEIYKKGV